MAPFEPSLDFLHTKTDQDCITVEVLPRRPRENNDSQSREFYRDLSAFSDSHIPETLGSPTISSISDFAEDGQSLHTCCSFSKPENHLALIERPEDRESLLQMLSDREKDLEYVRRELSEAQQAIQIIEDKMQSDASKWAILRKHSGELSEQTLERYLNEIGILKSQLADKRFLRPFTTRMEKNHIPTDIGYFQTNMDVIRGVIADFMSCAEMPHKCNIKLDEKIPDDLSLLFQRVVGESHSVLEFISFHCLLRSLLSAAVCEWVFECDVQENLFATCPLRETMLAHLAAQDGVDVVRNLDYAAHHTLIMSKYFQDELLPRRAEALVERAYSTVTPIFGLQKSSSLWKGNILEEWIRTRPALKDMFVSALKIKLRALVTKDTFEVAFPLEGDKFDPQSMEEENLGGESCDSLSGRTPLVRLCLVPGLRKHASNRKLVDYNSFQKPGPCADGQFDPIAKPLVDVYR